MPPRHPRPVTPAPTLPPPLAEPAATRIAARLETPKALLAIALVLVGAGAAWATWKMDLATKQDVAQEHAAAAAPVISLQVETQALRERMARVEEAVVAMKDNVAFIRAQLVEVQRATGARAVPPPPPTDPVSTP